MTKSEEAVQWFDRVLSKQISLWDFSFDFGEWLAYENGDELEKENEKLFDLLNDFLPDKLEELDSYELEDNRSWLEEYRNKSKKLIEK
ncbi:hypothetical protein HMPREF2758_05300 [Facklamia sp. HMSC062C11]|uniref:Uncharacterized protein n=1 Tax=Facklamia hominis TaxID=178214 RepID=A0AAJ1V358_9LACT|nr:MULTISPECIES: hypothetical protein [Facklamia]MDK7187071.1 hypothetical protein [Facklamia hominis]OFL63620.1 hypothetical protein HMPREF2758_05300 [Facklamia sp. HMSC062C11]